MRSEGDVHRGDSDIIPIAVDQELINKEGVKAYVLDLDGTVIDTLDKAIDLWAYIYWKIINGIRDDRMPAPDESDLERGRKFIQDTAGHGMPDQIAQIIKDAKGRDAEAYTLEEAITMYEDGYRKMFDKLFESRGEGLIFPRTKNFFDEVKRRRLEGEDIVLVQTSGNSTRILDHVLDRLGLQDIFGEHVYGSDPPYIKGRPHNKSDVIRLMKEQFGLKDHEITMYGDSLGDVKAGKDGGALTVVSARNEDEFKVREGAKPSFITRGEGVHPAILDVLNVVGVGRPGEESGQKLSLHKEIEHCQLIAQAA